MLAKLFCTKRKSASAQRCLRCLGATIDIVNPITRTANRSGQGGIFASMFTKGQHRGHGDHWAWRLTGNYCLTTVFVQAAYDPDSCYRPPLFLHNPQRRDYGCHPGSWGADFVEPIKQLTSQA